VIHGERLSVAVVDIEPDLQVPEHAHPHEQLGFVLKGRVGMVIEGETRELGPGEAYVIPPNARHSAYTGPDGAAVVDIFAPPRLEWNQAERLEKSRVSWLP
jgi:quercetin dioxygenase-like cupin family protein